MLRHGSWRFARACTGRAHQLQPPFAGVLADCLGDGRSPPAPDSNRACCHCTEMPLSRLRDGLFRAITGSKMGRRGSRRTGSCPTSPDPVDVQSMPIFFASALPKLTLGMKLMARSEGNGHFATFHQQAPGLTQACKSPARYSRCGIVGCPREPRSAWRCSPGRMLRSDATSRSRQKKGRRFSPAAFILSF